MVTPSYPGTYSVFGVDEVDNIDTVFANHVNRLRAEVLALQKTLGLNPQGDYSSVVIRLDNFDRNIVHITGVEYITGAKTFDNAAVYALVVPAPVDLGTDLGQASFQIGPLSGPNMAFGSNQIECRNNSVTAPLMLNIHGGLVTTGGPLQVGYSGTADLKAGTAAFNLVRVNSTGEASIGSTTHGLQVGVTAGPHTIIDGNEIMARGPGGNVTADLYLQQQYALVNIGGPVRINTSGSVVQGGNRHPFQICESNVGHMAMNGNKIQAYRENDQPTELYLNYDGGDVSFEGGVLEYTSGNGTRGFSSDECSVAVAFTPTHGPSAGSPGELQATGWDFRGYCPMRASTFLVGSSERVKTDIAPLPFSALETVENAPARMYRHLATHADPTTLHIGPMAEELPPELVLRPESEPSVSLMSMIGTLWAAVSELSAKVSALTETVHNLAGS